MGHEHDRAPTVITHEGGARFAARMRKHVLVLDQPERAGGTDTGPMPVELLGAALGSCIALYVQRFCATRGIDHAGMRVEVTQRSAVNPNRVAAFNVHVAIPGEVPEPYAAMLERVARTCPVGNTLEHGAEIAIHIDVGTAVPA